MNRFALAAITASLFLCSCSNHPPVTTQESPTPDKSSRPDMPANPAVTSTKPEALTGTATTGSNPALGPTGKPIGSGATIGSPPAARKDGSGVEAATASTIEHVVGTWKVDPAKTTIPAPNANAQKEQAAMRLEIKKDGTYALSGANQEEGTWAVIGDKLALTSTKYGARPLFKVSRDGKELSVASGDAKHVMVLIKAAPH